MRWSTNNSLLAIAEMGIETDTSQFKIGDGVTAWNVLAYGGLRGFTGFTGFTGGTGPTGFGATGVPDAIGVYSFALRPEEHQPSGTCNFSRIDTAQLAFYGDYVNSLYIYAVNYNVLRIMSGMGGLAYSN